MHHSSHTFIFAFCYSLPQNSLKDFITNEVLAHYTFLFKQLGENSGPDGSDIQSWVQHMLFSMQEMIEQHVHTAMDEST
jgi:hypothetical protein